MAMVRWGGGVERRWRRRQHTEYTKYTANAHNETFTLHSCAISRESFMQMFYAKICVPGRRLDTTGRASGGVGLAA